ncbi:prohibitin family protein [Methylophilus sp. 13]|uniref:prohibitin family protein n=1 Tax=Methylophilus sp. 13 TaxID=2781018 RepID=UPI00188E3DD5|nr:SPFH domain-containing protein [Methylophilus sp. 13]MBF5039859.1 prohibitin family protein [Methylophilus sp. 13]
MLNRIKQMRNTIRQAFSQSSQDSGAALAGSGWTVFKSTENFFSETRGTLLVLAATGAVGFLLYTHPLMQGLPAGGVGVRTNRLTGEDTVFRSGGVIVLPMIHDLRVFSLRDQTYRPKDMSHADGPSPLQSLEGLSLGVDLAVRYAVDTGKVDAMAKKLPDNIGQEIVEPAVQGIVYKTFSGYTVKEIFSSKRQTIQKMIEAELKPKLAADGIVLKSVQIGKIDLPADYRRGMESLLAEELASEKMRYTLELKDKRVKEAELEASAEKVRREKSAEAAANEQIIAAKAQEDAMKHILPFKQRQIEQRQLEAEADKQSRIRLAEGNAKSREIEAVGEANSREKLADAEAYRMERLGKVNAEQMEREGVLVTKHPLLIQKALADKLSDNIQVIIAPPPADGGFIGSALIGGNHQSTGTQSSQTVVTNMQSENEAE